jgi:hypothetical protein
VLYGIAYRGGCVVAVCVYALSEVVVIVVCELLLNAATYLTCAQFRNYIIAPFMVHRASPRRWSHFHQPCTFSIPNR